MMTTGWSWYVIFLVALNIGGCAWLLWWTAKRRPGDPKPEDTSHVWDGDITEYNKPLPRWWINLFYLTIVFSIGYLVWYPGLGNIAGYAKWTSAGEHDADKAAYTAKLEKTFAPYQGQSIDVLAKDPNALRLGRSIFGNTCSTCHGSSAQGAIGYPNLTDDIWHWGGSPDDVLTSVMKGREGVMAPWGKVLTAWAASTRSTTSSPTCAPCPRRSRACRTTTWPRRARRCTTTCAWPAMAPRARATRSRARRT